MVQVLVRSLADAVFPVNVAVEDRVGCLFDEVSRLVSVPASDFQLRLPSGQLLNERSWSELIGPVISDDLDVDESDLGLVELSVVLPVSGGIDFQHREGGKTGSGGQLSEAQAALERKERLRKLALETIDISKDPYFLKNHLGTFECKLCLTLHPNEGNYLAHTQGKRHQYNLGRRAAMEAKTQTRPLSLMSAPAEPIVAKRSLKIGRPGYKVTKSRDLHTRQRAILFEIDYPEAEVGDQPRHRFMSAYEQKVETPDKNYQYLLFACDPYETVAFKIPNDPVDKREGRCFSHWDSQTRRFSLQIHFLDSTP